MSANFTHQVKYEYYGGSILVSIEHIVLENFSTLQQPSSVSSPGNFSRSYVFHSFLYGDRKQDDATTDGNSKQII